MRIDSVFFPLSQSTKENQLRFCQQWLRHHQYVSAIAQTPSNIFIRKISKFTLSLLSNEQRTQALPDVPLEQLSHPEIMVRLDLAVNDDISKFKQFGQQMASRIKECFTKLNPRSEIVTNDECVELVMGIIIIL